MADQDLRAKNYKDNLQPWQDQQLYSMKSRAQSVQLSSALSGRTNIVIQFLLQVHSDLMTIKSVNLLYLCFFFEYRHTSFFNCKLDYYPYTFCVEKTRGKNDRILPINHSYNRHINFLLSQTIDVITLKIILKRKLLPGYIN